MSAPFHNALPAVGAVIVARMDISVVLPAPFGPSRPSTPGASESEKSRSAQTLPPYCLLTPWISSFRLVALMGMTVPSVAAVAMQGERGIQGQSSIKDGSRGGRRGAVQGW